MSQRIAIELSIFLAQGLDQCVLFLRSMFLFGQLLLKPLDEFREIAILLVELFFMLNMELSCDSSEPGAIPGLDESPGITRP